MANEPFDIGCLIPKDVKRVQLLMRLKSSSVYIKVLSAEEPLDRHSVVLGGAFVWREGGESVVIRVPPDIQIVVIDAGADT
jgi:hypothetical protein